MRSIGKLSNTSEASVFGDYLYSKGIEHQIEDEGDGFYSVWIVDDEQIPAASDLLKQFVANPGGDEFKSASKAAEKKRAREEKEASRKRSVVASEERVMYEKAARYFSPVTATLIAFSVAVAFFSGFGDVHSEVTHTLWFWPRLILHGQVWRIISPIFLHMGVLHLVFNMFWLLDLGGMIERKTSRLFLVIFVLVVAVLSNFGEYCWEALQYHSIWGPFGFGGMSGVVYGLFGYVWIRSKCDRVAVFALNSSVVPTMIVWLFLCMAGFVGDIANAAHVGGLLVGMAWGYFGRNRYGN